MTVESGQKAIMAYGRHGRAQAVRLAATMETSKCTGKEQLDASLRGVSPAVPNDALAHGRHERGVRRANIVACIRHGRAVRQAAGDELLRRGHGREVLAAASCRLAAAVEALGRGRHRREENKENPSPTYLLER